MANCCPLPTAIPTFTANGCEINLNQVHRVWVVREGQVIFDISTPANNLPSPTITSLPPEGEAAWTALSTLTDSGKVGLLPLFGGDPAITPGDEITFGGGDNTTLNGKRQHIGFNPSDFVARFDGMSAAQEDEINDLTCEGDALEVFLILHDKRIVGNIDLDDTNNLFTGIPLESALVLLGRNVAGFQSKDSNTINFQLNKDWSRLMYIVTPTFNTLTF